MASVLGRRRRDEDGAAAVEFTLVFVFILVPLIFGMITYGFALHYRQAVSQAATEGARAAAVTPMGWSTSQKSDRAQEAVEQALSAYGMTCDGSALRRNGSNIGVCRTTVNADHAEVEVSIDPDASGLVPIFPGLGFLVGDLAYTAAAEVTS